MFRLLTAIESFDKFVSMLHMIVHVKVSHLSFSKVLIVLHIIYKLFTDLNILYANIIEKGYFFRNIMECQFNFFHDHALKFRHDFQQKKCLNSR